MDVAFSGLVGGLALIGVSEPIVETADRWAERDSLLNTLPLPLFKAALVLVEVNSLAVLLCRQLRRLSPAVILTCEKA